MCSDKKKRLVHVLVALDCQILDDSVAILAQAQCNEIMECPMRSK